MKQLLLLISIIMCVSAGAQIYTRPNTTYGVISYRVASEKEIRIPTGKDSLGVPNTALRMSGFRYDTLSHLLYIWKPELNLWDTLATKSSSGGGGGSSNIEVVDYNRSYAGGELADTVYTGLSYDPSSFTVQSSEVTTTGDYGGMDYLPPIYDAVLNAVIFNFRTSQLAGTTYKRRITYVKSF